MKPRLERLESLRAIACIGVFVTHCYLAMLGSLSVSIFIMLSGFLMTYNALGKADRYPGNIPGCALFALKKIRKVYPLYFITLMFLILRLVILAPDDPPVEQLIIFAKQFVLCSLLIQSWPPNTDWNFAFNGVGWYLSTSLILYFAFPVILRRIKRCKNIKRAFSYIVLIYAAMVITAAAATAIHKQIFQVDDYTSGQFQYWFSYIFPLFRIGDFSIGCLLAYIFETFDKTMFSTAKATVFEVLAIILSIAAQVTYQSQLLPRFFSNNMLFIPSTALLIFFFALGKGRVSGFFDNKPLRTIAGYSVEIFLIHDAVIPYASPIANILPIPYFYQQVFFVSFIVIVTIVASVIYRRFSRRFPFFAVK